MADTATLGQRLGAEAVGTFTVVLLGVGAALASGGDVAVTGLGFGLTVLAMMAAFARVSGGHFNPAVSLGAALSGRLPWREAALYGLVQVFGAVTGAVVLWTALLGLPGFDAGAGFAQNAFGDESPSGLAWWAALVLELVWTAVLVMVFLAATDGRQPHTALAPVAVGLTVAALHFAALGATGLSVNPARSIAAGLFAGTGAIGQLWLFVLAPLIGGALSGVLHPALFGRDAEPVPGSGIGSHHPVLPAAGPDTRDPEWSAQPVEEVGPPREWGQPAAPATGQPWRPPAGTAAGPVRSPDDTGPRPDTAGAADAQPGAGEAQDLFPPSPTEPYWSQQLPQDWFDFPDDDDGRTQIRPTGDR